MRIGIIGAGPIGTTLSRHFAIVGHDVSLTGLLVARTVRAVASFADVVVVAVPFHRHRELPVAETAGKTVVDATNYDPALDDRVRELDEDRITSSELVQAHLSGAQVVKAFNAIRWEHLRDHAHRDRFAGRRGIPVSGDHVRAKKSAMALVEEIGFDAVDAGGLARGGRKFQPGTPVYAADLTAHDLRARLHLAT
ncbi:NADPH-dependent F420 reductase [Actinophytocola sp.]|uniref:NADPH-dependent F420 reductase n=1 Tax=Actinophytocola sp. TaxID=1872138 RepID=UPI003899F40F